MLQCLQKEQEVQRLELLLREGWLWPQGLLVRAAAFDPADHMMCSILSECRTRSFPNSVLTVPPQNSAEEEVHALYQRGRNL